MNGQIDQPPFGVHWRRADQIDLDWEDKADQLELQALANVRVAAEKWAASLAAILGLFGTVMLVKGRDDITKLTRDYEIAIAVALLLAFLAAALAVYEAALAAQGTPETVSWPGGGELRHWERTKALGAKKQLKCSRVLTFFAVVFMLTAVGVTWFGKAEKSSGGQAVVVTEAGAKPRCGTLVAGSGSGGALALRQEGGSSAPLGRGAAISVVPGCPEP